MKKFSEMGVAEQKELLCELHIFVAEKSQRAGLCWDLLGGAEEIVRCMNLCQWASTWKGPIMLK